MKLQAFSVLSLLVGSAFALGDPVGSVQALIGRVLGAQYQNAFTLEWIPADPATGNDVFELDTAFGQPVIRGNSGVSIASGLNWYLKYYCNASISWGRNGSGNNVGSLPSPLPVPATKFRQASPVKVRYMYNVCTYGYSLPWWNATVWQQEVDRLAMWGINLPLAFIGQEYITMQFLKGEGLSDQQVQEWMSGPAFLPWFRMNNMYAWGGPIGDNWIQVQHDLQLQVLAMMRDFGMTPVLPGFAGHFPASILTVLPNLNLTQNSNWAGFNSSYSANFLLEPTDPHYVPLGINYTRILLQEYGNPDEIPYLNSDTYNEMDPSSGDLTFLEESNAAVYQAMTGADSRSVYVMQGWLFYNGRSFWTPDRVQAYLAGVPNNSMLILDLYTEDNPVWQNYDSYYGKPWVWNALMVFGGRRGLYGNLTRIATGPLVDMQVPGVTMTGLGATPEAIEMIPIMFDLLFEMGWRTSFFDVDEWVQQYAVRRYGKYSPSLSQAMATLRSAAYNASIDTTPLEESPQISATSSRNTNATGILQALRLFVRAATTGEIDPTLGPFLYDLTDLTRQFLLNTWDDYHHLQGIQYQQWQENNINSSASVVPLTTEMMGILRDIDTVVSANENYLLGNWISDAKSWASNAGESSMLELNARNQITLWGPGSIAGGNEINDYAAKHWGGLVGDYYGARWQLHSNYLVDSVMKGYQINWTQYYVDALAVEQGFTYNTSVYPTTPVGSVVQLASNMLNRYANSTHAYTAYPNTDSPGGDMFQAWTTDVLVLQQLCDTDPTCKGFNSKGWVKNATSNRIGNQPSTLYVKP